MDCPLIKKGNILYLPVFSLMRIAKTVSEVDQYVGFDNYRLLFTEYFFIDAIKYNALFY